MTVFLTLISTGFDSDSTYLGLTRPEHFLHSLWV